MTGPDRIIRYMETYGKISALICAKELNITCLHKNLSILRERGWSFAEYQQTSKRNKCYYDYTIAARPKRVKK